MRNTKINPSKIKIRVATYRQGQESQKGFFMSNINNASKPANYFTFDHIGKRIVGSEFNFKKSGDDRTPQYEALMTAMARHPSYTLTPIASQKKVEKKQTYAGLTMPLMEEYLNLVYEGELAEVARAKFAEMKAKKQKKEMSFATIKSWFLELFPKFNVNKAKLEINAKKLENAKAPYRVIKVSVGALHSTNK